VLKEHFPSSASRKMHLLPLFYLLATMLQLYITISPLLSSKYVLGQDMWWRRHVTWRKMKPLLERLATKREGPSAKI
jgi:hypothetical protein